MVIKFAPFEANRPFYAPHRGSKEAAGIDLYIPVLHTIRAGYITCVRTNLTWECPPTHFGLIRLRSSLGKQGFVVYDSCVIDPDYRGEIMVNMTLLHGPWTEEELAAGERFAQLLVLPRPEIEIVLDQPLTPTERGQGGFGSTGRF